VIVFTFGITVATKGGGLLLGNTFGDQRAMQRREKYAAILSRVMKLLAWGI
jgi:hypothetical protein